MAPALRLHIQRMQMKVKETIGIVLVAFFSVASLPSCSVVRAFTQDKGEYMTPEGIMEEYAPKGRVEELVYRCSVPGGPTSRRLLVYLPEGYDGGSERYPVLYLFHGARGNETSWIKDGEVMALNDSLVAAGLARRAILVLPNMNQYDDDADFGKSRFKNPVESFFETNGVVESGFVDDVVAAVDSCYRTVRDRDYRAVAGLSIGAFQAMQISASHPGVFGYVGLFSPLRRTPVKKSGSSDNFKNFEVRQAVQFVDAPRVYCIFEGRSDFFAPQIRAFGRRMAEQGYDFDFHWSKGGHNWENWRAFFVDFQQRIF